MMIYSTFRILRSSSLWGYPHFNYVFFILVRSHTLKLKFLWRSDQRLLRYSISQTFSVVGWVTFQKIMPLLGQSCKSRLFRFLARLKFQDWPSVAVEPSECVTSISSSNTSPAFIIGPAAASKYSSHSRLLYTTCCFVILIICIF